MKNSLKQFLLMKDNCIFCNSKLIKKLSSLAGELHSFKSITIDNNDSVIDFPLEISNTDTSLKINLEKEKIYIDYASSKINKYDIMHTINNYYSFFQLLCADCDYAINSDFISVDADLNIDNIDIYSETFILEDKMVINDYKTNYTSITKYNFSLQDISDGINEIAYPSADDTIRISKIDFKIFNGLNKQQIKNKINVIVNFQ